MYIKTACAFPPQAVFAFVCLFVLDEVDGKACKLVCKIDYRGVAALIELLCVSIEFEAFFLKIADCPCHGTAANGNMSILAEEGGFHKFKLCTGKVGAVAGLVLEAEKGTEQLCIFFGFVRVGRVEA